MRRFSRQTWLLAAIFSGPLVLTGYFTYLQLAWMLNSCCVLEALHPVNDNCVRCRVAASHPGSTAATTIIWLLDEGTPVKKGEKIALLDDSALRQRVQNQMLKVVRTEAELASATGPASRSDIQERLNLERARQADLETDIANCTLLATCDGTLYYFGLDETVSGSVGRDKCVVAVGKQVHEGQRVAWIGTPQTFSLVCVMVPARFVEMARRSGTVRVRVPGIRHAPVHGKVRFVADLPEPSHYFMHDAVRYEVHVELTGDLSKFKSGRSARFEFFPD